MSRLSQKNKTDIINRIINGEKYYRLSKIYNVSPSTIGNIGQEIGMGVKINYCKGKKYTNEFIDKYLVLNESTIRRTSSYIKNCKAKCKWTCSVCGNVFESSFEGIKKRKNKTGCNKCGTNEYSVFHDFFDKTDEYSSYVLGVFIARGNISKRNTISFIGDRDKLNNLSKILSCTYPIKENGASCKLSFKSEKILAKLKEIKKTSIPKEISSKLLPHFLRGYIDFKGYVEKFGTDKSGIRITITGSYNLLKDIQQKYMQIESNYQKRKGHIRNNKVEFYITGPQSVYDFLSYVYNSEVNPLRYVSNNMYKTYLETKIQADIESSKNKYLNECRQKYDDLKNKLKLYSAKNISQKSNIKIGTIYEMINNLKPATKKIKECILKRKMILSDIHKLKQMVLLKSNVNIENKSKYYKYRKQKQIID